MNVRPGTIPGQCPVAQAVMGRVEPKLVITRAIVWLVQAPGQTEQSVWDVKVLAALAAMKVRRRFKAGTLRRRGEPGMDAGVELNCSYYLRLFVS